MVWILPRKRQSKTKLTIFSKYYDVLSNDNFILQQRKKSAPSGDEHRPSWRIITKGDYPYYEIAYGDRQEDIQGKEWEYIVRELPKLIPAELDDTLRKRWLVGHFTCLALATERVPKPISDQEEEGSEDELTDVEEFGSSRGPRSGAVAFESRPDRAADIGPADRFRARLSHRNFHLPTLPNKLPWSKKNEDSEIPPTPTRRSRQKKRAPPAVPLEEEHTQLTPIVGFSAFLKVALVLNMFTLLVRDTTWIHLGAVVLLQNVLLWVVLRGDPFTVWFGPRYRGKPVVLSSVASPKSVQESSDGEDYELSPSTPTARPMPAPQIPTEKHSDLPPKPLHERVAGEVIQRSDDGAPNTFCQTDFKNFMVRKGPNYTKNKAKAPSAEAMFECVGVDVFYVPSKLCHIASRIRLPPFEENCAYTSNGVPSMFILNMQLPAYEQPLPIYSAPGDGVGYSLVFYFTMTKEGRKAVETGATPAARLLERFAKGWKPEREDLHRRLKVIPQVVEPETVDLGITWNNVLSNYNAKPFLTGPKCHVFYEGKGYLEVDVDIHRYCYMARKTASSLIAYLPMMKIDLGIVVEGHTDDELPETLLGCVRMNHIDSRLAHLLDEPEK